MENFNLSKQQIKVISRAVYGDVQCYCQENFDRFLKFYHAERDKAKGQPIEPITIRFQPISYIGGDSNEK